MIKSFHESSSVHEAKAAINKARELLWGKSPAYEKLATLPKELARYANPVLESKEPQLLSLIVGVKLVCGSGSPQADIEAAMRQHPISESQLFHIADQLCGWVKRKADKQLEQGLPAIISRDEFHREYTAFVRRVDRDLILKGWARKPSTEEKLERLLDNFVRQLDLIEGSFDDKLEAISDYLQASRDRAMWSKSGDVHDESFTELEGELGRAWKNMHLAVSVEGRSLTGVQQGQLLYSRCMTHKARIQGMEPPCHFVPGCFHALADDLEIGWHPTYKALLKSPLTEPS